jgi:hypothetical protein
MTVAPILFLLLSALINWLIRNRHNRTKWVVSSALGFSLWAFLIFIDIENASVLEISVWQPEDLFQSPISLTIDAIAWPLMYGSVTVLLAVIFTSATRPVTSRISIRSFWFLYTSFALIAIMSANLLTTVLAWAMMDFGTLFFLLAISEGAEDRRAVFVRAGVNAVSVLLVIVASMTIEIQGVLTLDLTSTSAIGIMMLAIAATFRLGLIPLHFALPPIAPLRRGVGTLLRLFPPVVALTVLARVYEAGLPGVLKIIFLVAGGIGGLLGAIRWVLQEDTVRARPFFVLGVASLGLIVATITPNGSQVIVSAALVLLLAGSVLSLFAHHTPSHRLIPVAVSALLLGIPFTPGAVYAAGIAQFDLFLSAPVMSSIAVVVASLLALGCFHLFFSAETEWPIGESLSRVMFNVGLTLPVIVSIGVGSWMLRADPIRASIFAGLAAVLGVLFFLGFRNLSSWQVDRLRYLFARFEPDRVYEFVWSGLQRLLIGVRGLGELFEGVSGMLWLFVIVIFMMFIAR